MFACPNPPPEAGLKLSEAHCTNCTIGRYQDERGGAQCKGCPAGMRARDAKEGAGMVVVAAGGAHHRRPSFNFTSEVGQCTVCGPGTYQNETGQVSCRICERQGHFQVRYY